MSQEQEQIAYADPGAFHVGANTRFSLKPSRVEALAASIAEAGGILTPIEVRETDEGLDITSGFYRHAAAEHLNKNGGAVLIPYIVRNTDDKMRLLHQLTENMERENQSPMDMAIAIKALMDAGVERKEIRRLFARPGGKKGTEVQPASNSWVNIILGLLDLPKATQQKIHLGVIGLSAAYELGKVPADRRQAIIDRIEAEREKALEQEAKDEERFLAAEAKAGEATAKLEKVQSEEADLRAAIVAAEAQVKENTAAFRELQKVDYLNMEGDAKKAHREALNAAEANVKAAQKVSKESKNKLAKLLENKRKVEEATKEAREKLDAAKKAKKAPAKSTAISGDEVKKTAAAEGVGTGYVVLNASEMRGVINDLAKSPTHHRVAAIGAVLQRVFSGEMTTQSAIKEIAALVQIAPKDPKPAKKAAAPAAE